MLTRLLEWNRRRKQWHRDHLTAWRGQDLPDASGLSPFQQRCEEELVALLATHGLSLTDRKVMGSKETYIHASIRETPFAVYIYRDQAELTGPDGAGVNVEQWGVLSPEQLVYTFLGHVDRVVEDLSRTRGAAQQGDEADKATRG